MAGADAIKAEGVVADTVAPRVYRVRLANGHQLVAHLTAKVASLKLAIGDTVMLELSPFDLSKGRITGRKTTT